MSLEQFRHVSPAPKRLLIRYLSRIEESEEEKKNHYKKYTQVRVLTGLIGKLSAIPPGLIFFVTK
jgi:hypothetical protein